MPAFPILTYHSQIFHANSYSGNDHLALARDLELVHETGRRIEPLARLVGWLDGSVAGADLEGAVILTFDDGSRLDAEDVEHPEFGLQRGFRGILRDFSARHGTPGGGALHATSFVIASEEARQKMDARSLYGKNWMGDDWWRRVDREGLIAIENHSWDHNHPDLGGSGRGDFHGIASHDQCMEQVVRSAEAIEQITGRRPEFFAYPFGQSSTFMRESFFPGNTERHGCTAAFGTDPAPVTRNSDRWNLPRYVCGRDWNSPDGLKHILEAA